MHPKLKREEVVRTWARSGIKDFCIVFHIENKFAHYSTFFCHQGLEKLCKAYLLGTRAAEYESASVSATKNRIDEIARNECGHDLEEMIMKLVSFKVLDKSIFKKKYATFGEKDITGKNIIRILEKAYLECRYPVPNPVHRNYPIKTKGQIKIFDSPIGSTKLRTFAYETGLEIIEKIGQDFNLVISRDKFSSSIDDGDWIRFRRIFFKEKDL